MKTMENIKETLVGRSVFESLVNLLRFNDEDFALSEKRFISAVDELRDTLPPVMRSNLDNYLSACETDIISSAVYAGYLGFRVNLENYRHPIGVDFVHLDTIDNLKSQLFGSFPQNVCNADIRDGFKKSLPDGCNQLFEGIQEYYTHLECCAPKLAHYAGYMIANELLPWVEPGYRADMCQTLAFAAEIKQYFGFLPL